jgi:hypothetical protein
MAGVEELLARARAGRFMAREVAAYEARRAAARAARLTCPLCDPAQRADEPAGPYPEITRVDGPPRREVARVCDAGFRVF